MSKSRLKKLQELNKVFVVNKKEQKPKWEKKEYIEQGTSPNSKPQTKFKKH